MNALNWVLKNPVVYPRHQWEAGTTFSRFYLIRRDIYSQQLKGYCDVFKLSLSEGEEKGFYVELGEYFSWGEAAKAAEYHHANVKIEEYTK